MSVRVTNRQSSYFEIALKICDSPDNIVGNYRCEVGNRLGNDAQSYSIEGTVYGIINELSKPMLIAQQVCRSDVLTLWLARL